MPELEIRIATEGDDTLVLSFIKELAEYERLSHEVSATEDLLREYLFGERQGAAEVVIGHQGADAAGFALFFHNFSTFFGQAGYLSRRPRREAGALR